MNISDEVISVEEARAALKCMRMCNLDEFEALECVEDFVGRIRKVSTAKLLENIIDTRLSETQRNFIKEHWYSGKSTAQIARESGVSQANVYRTLTRANEIIKELLTPLVYYYNDLPDASLVPIYVNEVKEICSARNNKTTRLSQQLKNLRLSNSVTSESLARAMCITEKTLKDIECGKKEPTVEILEKYSKIFSVRIDVNFVNGKGRYEWKKA